MDRVNPGRGIRAAAGCGAAALLLCCTTVVHANDSQGVQPASLDVKSRIKSMEQVNVTAEKPIDDSAPPPSAAVADILAALEASEETVKASAED